MRTERIILKLRLNAKDVRRETDLLMMIHILEGRSMVPKEGIDLSAEARRAKVEPSCPLRGAGF